MCLESEREPWRTSLCSLLENLPKSTPKAWRSPKWLKPFARQEENLLLQEHRRVPKFFHCSLDTPQKQLPPPHSPLNINININIALETRSLALPMQCCIPGLHAPERGCTTGQWHSVSHGSLPIPHGGSPHQS